MRKIWLLVVTMLMVLVALAAIGVSPVVAKPSGNNGNRCTTIQDGTIRDGADQPVSLGYDQFGYNYQAHMFNGRYCDSDRVIGGDYCDADLIMWWSDVWLSNKDCNNDYKLDRGYGCDPVNADNSACEGAWLANHQRGVNEDGSVWTYFVKIVYPPGGVVDEDHDGYDDNTGGSIIWGSYVRVQQVSNDPALGEHGNIFSVQPSGFGAYK